MRKNSAKIGYCAIVCLAKNLVGGTHLILLSNVVPNDGLDRWTGFKNLRLPIGKGLGGICVS
jgi:hypothetical protein